MRQTNVGVLGACFSRTAVAVLAAAMVLAGCGDSGLTTAPVMPGGEGGMQAIGTDPNTGATIETNQDDYAPGEVVHLAGRGWAPGETVHLYMSEDPDTHGDVSQYVVADSSGSFNLHFYDVQVHDLGVTFTLTATGGTSGSRAVAVFTDGNVSARTSSPLYTIAVGWRDSGEALADRWANWQQ